MPTVLTPGEDVAKFMSRSGNTVEKQGAAAGSVLRGASLINQGLRLRVLFPQAKGDAGPLRGLFVLLDAGDNKHTDALSSLLGKTTDAAEVLKAIREVSPGCVSVVNTNILATAGA
jgi:hypothetical protein